MAEPNPLLLKLRTLPKEIRDLLAGGAAGMIAKSVVAPMDRIKIMYQVTSAEFRLRDIKAVARSIVEKEGAQALWKGNAVTMIRVFPYSGIQFMVFNYCKSYILNDERAKSSRRDAAAVDGKHRIADKRSGLTPLESTFSGMCAGATSSACTYPFDLARAQLAVLRGQKKTSAVNKNASSPSVSRPKKGLGYVWSKTFQQGVRYVMILVLFASHLDDGNGAFLIYELKNVRIVCCFIQGFRGLYRGITPTLLGILPYSGVAFTINEQSKQKISHIFQREPSTREKMLCGALSGLFAQTFAYPLEVTRRRMQTIGIVPTYGSESAAINFMGVSKLKHQADELPETIMEQSASSTKVERAGSTKSPSSANVAGGSGDGALCQSVKHHHKPPSMILTMRHLFEEQGIRGFYKGVSMNWIKGPVAFSISFTVFDELQGWAQTESERAQRSQFSKVSIQRRLTNNEDI